MRDLTIEALAAGSARVGAGSSRARRKRASSARGARGLVALGRAGTLALASMLGLAWAPQRAHAADKPKIVLLPYQALNKGVAPELAEQTGGVIAQELGALGVEVLKKDDVAESAAPSKGGAPREGNKNAPTGDPGAGDKAQALVEQAKTAIEDSNVGPAIEQLKKAVKLLTENGDAVPDLRLLSEAYLQLGIAYFRDGDEDQANDALSQAVHFMPQRELEETEYPPIFIRAYQRVRFDVLRRPRTTIEVRASPGSQVLLDGRNLGKAPLNLTEVLPGTHWVRVERAGQPPEAKKLLVRAKNTILVEFSGATGGDEKPDDAPVGSLGAVARNALEKGHLDQLRATGKREGAAFVVFGAVYKTDTAYNIYTSLVSVADGSVGRAVDVAFDLDMLSAQIEVYKLAEDLKKQVLGGKLNAPVAEQPFVLAPKIDVRQKVKKVESAREVRVGTAAAAPGPIAAPKEPEERTPVAAGGGAAPKNGGVVKPADLPTKPVGSTVIPKDELTSTKPSGSAVASGGGSTVAVTRDEQSEEGGSSWWIWALVGVAVAGGAAAGGILLFGNQGADDTVVRITWTR
jgi:tetratricopeptide (TPR) repeat protein